MVVQDDKFISLVGRHLDLLAAISAIQNNTIIVG
jgi:hypothetical protein